MHKIALDGPWPIYWYGVLVALGFLAGLWTASRRAQRAGVPAQRILDIGPWLILGALVGARAMHVITYWDEEFAGRPWLDIINVRQGGLVFYGGFIGAALATIIYLRVKRMPFWPTIDALTPSVALGAVFGRLGCFMNGCCYGRVCDLPWAVRFPVGHETHGTAVHPVQIYDALANLILYAGLAWLHRRKQFDGQVFPVYLMAYAVARSFVETFRADYLPQNYFLGGALTPAQFISVGMFGVGAGVYLWLWRHSRSNA